MQKLLTQDEVADVLRVSTRTLQKWRLDRRIPYIRTPCGGVRFDLARLGAWLTQHETQPVQPVTKRMQQIANRIF